LISYAGYRAQITGDLSHLERYARSGREWLDRTYHGRIGLQAELTLETALLPWIRPRRELVPRLLDLSERMLEQGEVEYGRVAGVYALTLGVASGSPLDEMIAHARAIHRGIGLSTLTNLTADALELLRTPRSESALDEAIHALHPRVKGWLENDRLTWIPVTHGLIVLAVLGRFQLGFELVEQLEPRAKAQSLPGPFVADFLVLRGFLNSAVPHTSRRERVRAHRVLRRSLRPLRIWARHSPDLHTYVALLEAERERLRGRYAASVEHYLRAADQATRDSCLYWAGLALERCADWMSEHADPRAAQVHADARRRYLAWGAVAKSESMQRSPCTGDLRRHARPRPVRLAPLPESTAS